MSSINDWCTTRNMSWEAIRYISTRWQLSFEDIPVSGDGFWKELARVRPDWSNTKKWPIPVVYPDQFKE